MAVIAATEPAAVTRPPRTSDFMRLKVRLLRNGMRGQPGRIALFLTSVVIALLIAGSAFAGLAGSGLASYDTGYLVTIFAGTALVLGWALFPLLFFGVDETIDPSRFSLLPLRNSTIVRGMLGAAVIGVPAVATLLASGGLVVAAAIRFGPLAAVAAAVGAVIGLALGVVASRAVTSAFASSLRSRKMRDLAAVAIAVLASSIAPVQIAVMSAGRHGTGAGTVRIAKLLAWTPFGAAYALPFDVARHAWLALGVRVLIVIATLLLLLAWWNRTLESAMIGTSSSTGKQRQDPAQARGAVANLVPAVVRLAIGTARPFSAICAREWRFWWRDPRRRASLISILMASAVLPISLRLAGSLNRSDAGASSMNSGLSFALMVSFAGTLSGMLLANQFAFDGSAYAAHLLTRVSGRLELRARAAGLALIALPVQLLVVIVVGLLSAPASHLPAGVGLLLSGFGSAVAISSLLCVFAAYPLPESSNPFALNTGGASAKGLLAIGAMITTLVLSVPLLVLDWWLSAGVGPWLVLVVGVVYGGLLAAAGTAIGGSALDRRGPELLLTITPRR